MHCFAFERGGDWVITRVTCRRLDYFTRGFVMTGAWPGRNTGVCGVLQCTCVAPFAPYKLGHAKSGHAGNKYLLIKVRVKKTV